MDRQGCNNHQRIGGYAPPYHQLQQYNGNPSGRSSFRQSYHHGNQRYNHPQAGVGGSQCSPQQQHQQKQQQQQQQHHERQQQQHQQLHQQPSHQHTQGGVNASPLSSFPLVSPAPPSTLATQQVRGPQPMHSGSHPSSKHQHAQQPTHQSAQNPVQQQHASVHRPIHHNQTQQHHHQNHQQQLQQQQQRVHGIMDQQQLQHQENSHHRQPQHQHSPSGNNSNVPPGSFHHQQPQQQHLQQCQQDTSGRRSQQYQAPPQQNQPISGAACGIVSGTTGIGSTRTTSLATRPSGSSGFTLSPTAQEFVPASFLTPRDRQFTTVSAGKSSHPQQPQQPIASGGGIGEGSHHNPYDDQYGSGYGLGSSYDEEDDALLQLQMFITDVTLSPAMFESRVCDLAEVIYDDLKKNPANTPQIVATIFQAGVLQQNFRYSGARLCDYLSELVVVQGRHLIREQIIEQAHKAVSAGRKVYGDKERDKESRGVVLFCAELLSQLDLGYGIPLAHSYPDMGPKLSSIISELIRSLEKDNQKNAIQALKLCGGNLEKLCEGDSAMDVLLAECEAVEAREGVDATIKAMLQRLPQLRQQHWGYVAKTKIEPPAYVYGQHAQVDYSQLPVMYGPDGLQVSPEEMGFLDGGNGNARGDYPSDLSQSTSVGMDDEALEAYEMFLLETGQK
ncbi:uncharacterized protein LOC111243635 [Varroa destructor]|uniref:MIF4G domain-containing protein n=1 Tax=Varroa destructor TaxID=109461 RepID=A0A7M7J0Q3_VARDE|nr:uncharacterized protein LOC111243635 [Varroa destructor]